MRNSQPINSQEIFLELLENIYGDATLSDLRDLLLTFKEKGVRAPQITHFLMSVIRQDEAKNENQAVSQEIEDRLFEVLDMASGLMSENFTIWKNASRWGPVTPIFYLAELCPICNYGILGFRRLNNTESIVIACHECESIWASPDNVNSKNLLHASTPDFGEIELGASIFGDNAAWATADEIQRHGWVKYIAGQESPVY